MRQRHAEALAAAVGPILNILDDANPDSFALWASERMEEYRRKVANRFETHRDPLTIVEVYAGNPEVRELIRRLKKLIFGLLIGLGIIIEETLREPRDHDYWVEQILEAKELHKEARKVAESLVEEARTLSRPRPWMQWLRIGHKSDTEGRENTPNNENQ